MSLERWNYIQWQATGDAHWDLRQLEHHIGELLEVTDTGAADAQVVARHNLGRVPIGMRVVNCVLGTPGYADWYRLDPDDVWDEASIRFRFRASNARLLIEVF